MDIDEAAVIVAMTKEGRLVQDVSRDARSKPEKVIPLLGLESGDRVADIFGGGGYYSELLASVVGALIIFLSVKRYFSLAAPLNMYQSILGQ